MKKIKGFVWVAFLLLSVLLAAASVSADTVLEKARIAESDNLSAANQSPPNTVVAAAEISVDKNAPALPPEATPNQASKDAT
ncbi:MAG: hypothetical protein HY099_02500, partial [Nitrospirae bacterium]|nr:hypothetical protein [Nitrospirota bacterium]